MMRQLALKMNVLAVVVLAVLLLPAAVSAMDIEVRLFVDGVQTEEAYDARLIDDVPFVPETFVREELGALAIWDGKSRTLALERGKHKAQFVLNERYYVTGDSAVRLDVPPIVLSGEIYLPAGAVGQALNIKVSWDVVTHALQFYIPQGDAIVQLPAESGAAPDKSADDVTVESSRGSETESNSPGSESDRSGIAAIGAIEIVGDQIIVTADRHISANVFSLTDPDRLVIDIPDSKLGSLVNGQPSELSGRMATTHPYIEQIRYALFHTDPSTVRLVIDLTQPVQYFVLQQKEENRLAIDIRSEEYKVVLDAGHGGKDPGAITYSGKYEKDFTLPLTLKVYDLLLDEPFIKPILTRSDDTFIELDRRAEIANSQDADIFLSFHGNTYIPSVHGTETYYYDPESKYLAEIVHQHVVDATGFRDRNVRKQEYKVLVLTNMPAALIEFGYVSNKDQEALLYDDAFQDKLAQAVVAAIKQYLKL